MATSNDLTFKIEANTKGAVDGIGAVNDSLADLQKTLNKTGESLANIEGNTDSLGTHALHLNAAIELAEKAFEALHKVFEITVEKFTEADTILQGLSNTLQLLGEQDVKGTVERFEEFAKGLESTGNVSEETTLKLISLAKAMGRTDEQAESLARTSANLAVVNGESVQTNFDKLINTFRGVTRGVEVYDQSLKRLTDSQKANGVALARLDKDFAGFAQKSLGTIAGQSKAVAIVMEHTLEDLGSLFAAFFKLDDKHVLIDALNEINEVIKSLKPTVVAIRKDIDDFVQRMINGFSAVKDKADILEAALIAVGAALLYAFGPAALKSLIAFIPVLIEMTTAAVAAAIEFGAIAAAVIGVVAAIDILMRNFAKFEDFVETVLGSILQGFLGLGEALIKIFSPDNLKAAITGDRGLFDQMSQDVKDTFDKAFKQVKDSADKNLGDIDFGIVGKVVKGAMDFTKGFNQELTTTAKTMDTVATSTGAVREAVEGLTKDGQTAFDNLIKKVEELKLKNTELGQDTVKIAQQRLELEMKNIDLMSKELEAKGALNDASKKLLQQAKDLITQNSNLEVYNKQKKALDEIIEKNKDLQVGIDNANATQADAIDNQLKRQLEILEKKREELKIQGLLTDSVNEGINAQGELLKQSAQKAKDKAPNPVGESMQIAGQEMAKGLSDAFAPLTGFTSGVGAYIAAAQAVVDAGPQLLESIAHLADSIVELPGKIVQDLGKVFQSLIKLVTDFIPNLLKAIPEILKLIANFYRELPKAFAGLLKQLPGLITDFLDQIPDLVQDMVQSIAEELPTIAMALIDFLIKESPRLSLKITQMLAIQLPVAIINGLIAAFKNIAGMIANLFKGKFNVDFIDTKKIADDIKNVAKKVAASTSRIFNVSDLADKANAALKANSITKQIDDAGKKAVNYLKMAWQWIWDKIIQPFLDLLKKAWQWVWDKIIEPIYDLVKKAFQWVWDKVLKPITNLVMSAWQWVWDKIIQPIGEFLKTYWNAIFDTLKSVWNGLITVLKDTWNWISGIFTGMWDAAKKIWQTLMDVFSGKLSILDGIRQAFGVVFDAAAKSFNAFVKIFQDTGDAIAKTLSTLFTGIKDTFMSFINGATSIGASIWNGFKDALSKVGDFFGGLGANIWSGLKSGLDGLGKFFTDMFDKINPANLFTKIFKVDFGGRGTVEKALGIDVPFMSFAGGGTVPGNAMVPGNSFLNDKIVAMLSPGEAIIDREKMNNPTIKALIEAIMSGKFTPPKFGWGIKNVVSSVSNAVNNATSAVSNTASNIANLTPEKAWDAIQKAGKDAADLVKSLDPSRLWDIVKDKFYANFMKMFEMNKFATGGLVGDTVPALLTPGEFVMNTGAVGRMGVNSLHAMNSGKGGHGQNITYNINLPVTIENNGKDIDPNWVRTKVLPTIQAELKRASLKGDFVLSQKGVRDA